MLFRSMKTQHFMNGVSRAERDIQNKVSRISNVMLCDSFRRDTEACSTGCPDARVAIQQSCPWDGYGQGECPCYK